MLRVTRRPASAGESQDDAAQAPEVLAEPTVAAEPATEAGEHEAEPGMTAAPPIGVVPPAPPLVAQPSGVAASRPLMQRSWQPPRQGSRDRPPTRDPGDGGAPPEAGAPGIERVATAPQLRRFIKSRAYVPMHELRRRFAINGNDDDVTPVELDRSRVYVGLPEREGRLLGELLRGGDIGYELSLDPISPIVVGVYPMRPVSRG